MAIPRRMDNLQSSADLRIADLPPDLRAKGQALRDRYHALAAHAGLLTETGAVDLGKLDDLAFVKSAELAVLREIVATVEELERLTDPRFRQYRELQAAFRAACDFDEFRSVFFTAEAISLGLSSFQWVEIRTVHLQTGGIATPAVYRAQGPRRLSWPGAMNLRGCTNLTALPVDFTIEGRFDLSYCSALVALPEGLTARENLHLGLCTSLTTIPESLVVLGSLFLPGCLALQALPANLTVPGNLTLTGCSAAVKKQGQVMKAAGRIGGQLFL